jgi:hypothetical protein
MNPEAVPPMPAANPQPTRTPARWGRRLPIIGAVVLLGVAIGLIAFVALPKPAPPLTPAEQFEQLVAKKKPWFTNYFTETFKVEESQIASRSSITSNPKVVESESYPYVGEMTFGWVSKGVSLSDHHTPMTYPCKVKIRYLYSAEKKAWVWGSRTFDDFIDDCNSPGSPFPGGSAGKMYFDFEAMARED